MSAGISQSPKTNPALVHDWLVGLRGGERCLLAFCLLYKNADIYSLFYKASATHSLIDTRFKGASAINKIPFASSIYKFLLPFFPMFSRIPALDRYKIRISLSHAASKNVRARGSGIKHICYCFTPMRYIWDQAARYLGWKSVIALPLIYLLRIWDRQANRSVHHFIAISRFVSARIRRFYGRRAIVIYPPVAVRWLDSDNMEKPAVIESSDSAYLFAGALVPYKGAELTVRAFTELGKKLWVAGKGPELEYLKKIAGDNVSFLGAVSDKELAYLINSCRALVFPCKEDFGIIPLEAQAAGKPVIALHAGACRETINACKHWLFNEQSGDLAGHSYTGVFIRNKADNRQLAELKSAISFFERHEHSFSMTECRAAAERFSPAKFYDSWREFADECSELQDLEICSKQEFVEEFERLRTEKIY